MSAAAGRVAGKVGQAASKAAAKTAETGGKPGGESALKKGARRDPELYVLLTVMTGAFGLVGYYFGRKPTSASSEAAVSMAKGTMPWQVGEPKTKPADEHFKYQYHPGGDPKKAPKDAPSALNVVIVPNVTLRKSQHDQWNKWGKDGY